MPLWVLMNVIAVLVLLLIISRIFERSPHRMNLARLARIPIAEGDILVLH